MTIPLPVRSCIVTYLGEGRGLHYSLGVSAGERLIAQPIGTSLDLFTADQLRAYGEAVRAEERERWEAAMKQAWSMIDPFNPAGVPGSYARGQDSGIVAALTTVRANYVAAAAIRAAAQPQA